MLVALIGVFVHRPLSRVPENTMKFAVGLMLTTFGIFWGAEGAGVEWPGNEVALVAILIFVCVVSLGYVWWMRRQHALAVMVAARMSLEVEP